MNWRRWRWKYWMDVFRRRQVNRDLDEEIQAHLAMDIQRRIEEGELPDAARTAALREIRSVALVKEATREVWAWGTLDRFLQDLRYAARVLLKNPAFTTIAVLSLALGIGLNTAIFSMINAVLLQSLPVTDPEGLVVLTSFQRNGPVGNFAYPDYERIRAGSKVFSGVLAASRPAPVNAGINNEPRRALVQIVSGNYFSVLGVRPLFGRLFAEEDENSPSAVISHDYWQRTFGGDSDVIGRSVAVNGSVATIVGVTPPEFFGETVGQSTDIWAPIHMLPAVRPGPFNLRTVRFVTWLYLMGRLKPNATIEQAAAEGPALVAGIHADLRVDVENDYLHRIAMEPGSRGSAGLRNGFGTSLLALMALVAIVLLIACANLASLLLARASARQREIATRLALGASRVRLIRQLLSESMLLAVTGGLLGLLFSGWMNRFLLGWVAEGIGALTVNLYPNTRTLLFTLTVAVATGVVFGLAPALQATRIDLGSKLKSHSSSPSKGSLERRPKNVLITVQVAFSLVLLAGGLLFARTLFNLKTLDTGFRTDDVLLVEFGPYDRGGQRDLAVRLLERVSAIAGVQSATVSVNTPLGSSGSGVMGLQIEGYEHRTDDDRRARADWVGPDYFKTLGIPIVQGREFRFSDTANSRAVAIINETSARFYFGEQPALGKTFRHNEKEYEIVGVARDTKYADLRAASPRVLYFAFLQSGSVPNTLELRTDGAPLAVAGGVRQAITEVDSGLNIREIASFAGLIDRKLLPEYLVAGMSGFFGGLTVTLVCIGIYGTLGFAVARRTNEIGLRMALGATRATVSAMVLRDIFWPLVIGMAAGISIVLALGPLVSSLVFGVQPHDAATLVCAVLLLTLVAVAAGSIPARRACRVDPVTALRFE